MVGAPHSIVGIRAGGPVTPPSQGRSGQLHQGSRPSHRLSDVVDAELANSPFGVLVAGWDHSHDGETG